MIRAVATLAETALTYVWTETEPDCRSHGLQRPIIPSRLVRLSHGAQSTLPPPGSAN